MFPLLFPLQTFLSFVFWTLAHRRTFKHSNWTHRLQPISSLCSVLYPGQVSDDPPSSKHSDWLAESQQGRDRGCGNAASLLMSSLSSWTKGNVVSLLATTLNRYEAKTKNLIVRTETFCRLWDPLTSNTNLTMKTHFAIYTVTLNKE